MIEMAVKAKEGDRLREAVIKRMTDPKDEVEAEWSELTKLL